MVKCLLPDREPMIDQSENTTTAELGEPVSFIGVTYRNMGKELLTGAEMTQRQLHHGKATPKLMTAHESWKPRACCTLCRQVNRLMSFPGSSVVEPLTGGLTVLWFFQAAWLICLF